MMCAPQHCLPACLTLQPSLHKYIAVTRNDILSLAKAQADLAGKRSLRLPASSAMMSSPSVPSLSLSSRFSLGRLRPKPAAVASCRRTCAQSQD